MPFQLWRRRHDCVVLHEPNPAAALAVWLHTPARHLVVWHHSDIVRPRWAPLVYGPIQRALYRRAACVVTSSPDLAAHSPALRHARRVEVIPYGIHLQRFLEADHSTKTRAREIRARHAGPIVLFVGRLVYYKGVEVLLEAMARCPGTLIVVGDGPLGGQLRARARALGVESRAVFVGAVSDDDLLAHLLAADIFVLPSTQRTEAFGIAQVEAMACGLPVVSTDLPTGVPWVNQHEVTGLVVAPGDPAALAGAIRRLGEDELLRRKLGEAGRRRAIERFARERMGERFVALIESVVGG
jgi:rhamnosyl/mannosyltransferase